MLRIWIFLKYQVTPLTWFLFALAVLNLLEPGLWTYRIPFIAAIDISQVFADDNPAP